MATNNFVNAGAAVGATATDLFTAPASSECVVHALYVSNVDGTNAADVTVEVYDNSANATYTIAKTVEVPADTTLTFDKSINLEENDVLRVTASAAGDLEAFASILKIT